MADDLLSQIRLNGAVPRHVAVIMDGNGRWARERSLPRPLGHRAGMKAVREAVEGALEAGVEVLTLFAFSEENWQRPATEISALMRLLEEYIAREVAELKDQGVAVHVLGDRTRLARRRVSPARCAPAHGRRWSASSGRHATARGWHSICASPTPRAASWPGRRASLPKRCSRVSSDSRTSTRTRFAPSSTRRPGAIRTC